jgi:CHAT domain-containing protein
VAAAAVYNQHRPVSSIHARGLVIVKAFSVACALVVLANACSHEDTPESAVWRRSVEPRLTTTKSWHPCEPIARPGHVVADARCAAADTLDGRCEPAAATRAEAVRMLFQQPQAQCTDDAIAALESLSRVDAGALSDVAAAYYVRAQRSDNPADLLRALDRAEHAARTVPIPAGARFNRALALEALELNEDALEAWRDVARTENGQWADEAREHENALRRKLAVNGAAEWKQASAQLDAALQRNDTSAVASAIAGFPATAEKYFENELLPAWAAAPSPDRARRVATLGNALSIVLHDQFTADVAAAVENARTPAQLSALREGHLQFQTARKASRLPGLEHTVPPAERAGHLLRSANSPLDLLAEFEIARSMEASDRFNDAVAKLNVIDAEARRRHYTSIGSRVEMNRFYAYSILGRHIDSAADYNAAIASYRQLGDWEDIASIRARRIGDLGLIGDYDGAFREALECVRVWPRIQDEFTRHLVIGATAKAAADLGFPDAALRYQTAAVRDLQRQMNSQPENAKSVEALEGQIAIALRERAAIKLRLPVLDLAGATRDLNEAIRLNGKLGGARPLFLARAQEVLAQASLTVDPQRAAEALTAALRLAPALEFPTYRASLFIERAQALSSAHKPADAENDLRSAIVELHREEALLLANRSRGQGDELLASYFLRFDDAYALLIRQLMDEGRAGEAFQYAERERAFEPLDLILKLPSTSADFRAFATKGDVVDIAELQRRLPANSWLVEYKVVADRTYAWVIGRGAFVPLTLQPGRDAVGRWTAALQQAAREKQPDTFEAGLYAPYDKLLREPLRVIESHSSGARIVVVPDDAMFGLPFAALHDTVTGQYLVQQHIVAISGSAMLDVYSHDRDRAFGFADRTALVVGDPAFDPALPLSRSLPRLPAAAREAEEIARLYAPGAHLLLGEAATVPEFLRLARGSSMVHIAAHGITGRGAPAQSFFAFAPSRGDRGVLDAELLMKRLEGERTRLVIFGACSSASGEAVGAEGVSPLVRPVITSGVPGVIGSLWSINDATAEEVLVSFHRHYRQGIDAAAALQAAQVEMLKGSNAAMRAAIWWAPFQAIGYASSPFAPAAVHKQEKPP